MCAQPFNCKILTLKPGNASRSFSITASPNHPAGSPHQYIPPSPSYTPEVLTLPASPTYLTNINPPITFFQRPSTKTNPTSTSTTNHPNHTHLTPQNKMPRCTHHQPQQPNLQIFKEHRSILSPTLVQSPLIESAQPTNVRTSFTDFPGRVLE